MSAIRQKAPHKPVETSLFRCRMVEVIARLVFGPSSARNEKAGAGGIVVLSPAVVKTG
ncbi:MAG: hypothetical protein ACR650_08650 [Methylocystis sp.]|jgi:hypothetical protein